ELDIDIRMLLGIESGEENYLSRIPSLLMLTLARDRNLKALSDKDVLRKFNAMIDSLCEARYILENQELYHLFLDDSANQIENILKRYMALQILLNK
ncbi:MAG: XRE family transcriptional regulator, partial [Bacillota bacterium]|nr:XRE family transcriptional regulator [Bacillota bacterium]